MKKRFISFIVLLFMFSFAFVSAELSVLQKTACNAADLGGTCATKLESLNLVTNEQCCAELSKCCLDNTKDLTKYSGKEVFLISNNDWKELLSLVPVTTWTTIGGELHKYPTLVYLRETSFDMDSPIYFMQQYSADELTIVGNVSQELMNLLVAQPELGAGLQEDEINFINLNDYLSFWDSYNDVVYVEENYELALLASTYASLTNSPLIIQGTTLDSENVFSNKKVICVGSVSPAGNSCVEQYNLEELQQIYMNLTNTDKVVLVNPNDLNTQVTQTLYPDRSAGTVTKLYSQNSMIAPIIAAGKNQLIISTTESSYQNIDSFIKAKAEILDINFLTIMAAPNVIPYREYMGTVQGYPNYRSLDQTEYADFDGDRKPEKATGRVHGVTISDTSSYVARSLFYDDITDKSNMKFMATGRPSEPWYYYVVGQALDWSSAFTSVGYNALADVHDSRTYSFNPFHWADQHMISYADHGSSSWAGISSSQMPLLENSIVFNDACSTCSTYSSSSFCNVAIRQGAMAHMGAVTIGWTGNKIYMRTMNGLYYDELTVGEAFMNAYDYYSAGSWEEKYRYMTMLSGDPTFRVNPPNLLSSELNY